MIFSRSGGGREQRSTAAAILQSTTRRCATQNVLEKANNLQSFFWRTQQPQGVEEDKTNNTGTMLVPLRLHRNY